MYSIGLGSMLPIISVVLVGCIFVIVYLLYISSYIADIKSGDADIEIIDESIYDSLSSVRKRRKITKTINSIVFYGLLICIAPFFIFAIINKSQNNLALFGDKAILAVASGSMSQRNPVNDYLDKYNLNNQFNTFDLIVVQVVDEESDLEPYDVVTYVDAKGTLIIHRIVEIKPDPMGNNVYITRGDSNDTDDKPIRFADIKGEYTNTRIPFVGALVLFFQSYMGIATIIILALCLIMVDKCTDRISKEKKLRLTKLNVFDLNESNDNKISFIEYIYYKGFIYQFNEKGFVDKTENKEDNNYFEESKTKLIKVYTCDGKEPKINKYEIQE